ncbi:DUF1700 domain-containing protein [Acutalibacter sp.]|uniref:DUF1700 domain-containing protein n=1 Tax=Acutalibacter sp. TaxID=1918636 RepID=UPI0021729F60|nr:DUF1700 domain-containing protein [Acutalibacter sp.]
MTMETSQYLERIERYLRPLPVAERVDIVAEIKSEMLELEAAGMPPQEIAARLGTPEELARGYLGEAIVKSPRFSLRKLGAVAAFYSLAGAAWLFILPVTSICGVSFMLCGPLAALAGIVKFGAHLLGFEMPWVVFQIGGYTLGPALALVCSVIVGALLFVAGRLLWSLTVAIVRRIAAEKSRMKG